MSLEIGEFIKGKQGRPGEDGVRPGATGLPGSSRTEVTTENLVLLECLVSFW